MHGIKHMKILNLLVVSVDSIFSLLVKSLQFFFTRAGFCSFLCSWRSFKKSKSTDSLIDDRFSYANDTHPVGYLCL